MMLVGMGLIELCCYRLVSVWRIDDTLQNFDGEMSRSSVNLVERWRDRVERVSLLVRVEPDRRPT